MSSLVDDIIKNKEAFLVLDRDKVQHKRPVVIDNHPDEVVERTRGYGDGQKPEDYLESFKEFISTNLNTIAALKTVCTKPSELTRESLKGLKLELDRHNFTENQLNTAWKEMTNQDIVADIIAFIRQQALGSNLISHETRVKNAFAKLRLNHTFNKTQLDWLNRIEKVMLEETVLDKQIFEIGAFKNAGGFTIIDRRFGGKLILFEQMLGRATRLCPSIGKTNFEIYDPVGVYESLQDVSNMKPVVTNPSTTFEDLLSGLSVAKTDDEKAYLIDTTIAIQVKCHPDNLYTAAGLPAFMQTFWFHVAYPEIINPVYMFSCIPINPKTINQCLVIYILITAFWKVSLIKIFVCLILESNCASNLFFVCSCRCVCHLFFLLKYKIL